MGSNPAGGEILSEPKWRFIAKSLSCSPFHRLEMTEILLKGCKTLTHPSIKINIGHCDLYFMVQWLCHIPWRLFHVWTLLFGIMNQYDPMLDLKINVGYCDLYFMVQWFCVISWRLFDVSTLSLQIMGQYDLTFGLKMNVCHCDLYFMVHWFCLTSQRLFDGCVSYFQIMRQCDTNFDPKYRSTWSSDFA